MVLNCSLLIELYHWWIPHILKSCVSQNLPFQNNGRKSPRPLCKVDVTIWKHNEYFWSNVGENLNSKWGKKWEGRTLLTPVIWVWNNFTFTSAILQNNFKLGLSKVSHTRKHRHSLYSLHFQISNKSPY